MSKYGIFLKNSQNTACQTELWFHFTENNVAALQDEVKTLSSEKEIKAKKITQIDNEGEP